jgi:hypothetical protein
MADNFGRDVNLGFPTVGVAKITDTKTDYATPGLDTEAEIIVAINLTNTKINTVIDALENAGISSTV